MKLFLTLLGATLSLLLPFSASAENKTAAEKGSAPVTEVTLDQAEKLTQTNTNLTVLDVRTRKEFAAGHLAGAKNLDFYAPDFQQQLQKLDKSKPYLVHCATGGRSAEARDKMKELGFKELYHMDEGYKGWSKAGKKTEK